MTPQQIRQAQQELGLSTKQLAKMLGFSNGSCLARLKIIDQNKPSAASITPCRARLLIAYLEGYRPDDWGN